ncbi:MAG: DEAD/DEAH box helicase family protein [Elusimicrobia bacterium]|nr:DEAD/DEAH box helicase family protein [Elusimicrobiota bacterium]
MQHLQEENAELRRRLGLTVAETPAGYGDKPKPLELPLPQPLPAVVNDSPVQDKIGLFRSLFKGREDVYAVFWQNERTGKKGYSPACEDPWSLRKGQPRKYLPLTDQVVHDHLSGNKTIGIFPLLKDSSCWFLACDFDKEGWKLDAMVYLETCARYRVPAYLERSRSGNGGHVWIFFSAAVSAVQARQLGMRLLRQTMDARADMDLGSYDRFFPNQDFVPKGGFGNLIAAPLQKKCRAMGNTEFLDVSSQEMEPWPDPWAFLSGVQRLTPAQLEALLEAMPPVAVGPGKAMAATPATKARHPAPKQIRCEFGASFSLEKSGIPPWMLSQIKHLASLHNPQFYKNEKQRRSNHATPRFIKCYREDFSHIHLPRGLAEDVQAVAQEAGSELVCVDRRQTLSPISLRFQGSLRPDQDRAMQAVLAHDMGFLVAPPGAGKTVMGCYAAARRGLPTLILADRKPILEQWRKQLMALLGLSSRQIGQVGGGRDRQSGVVDLAMLPSLTRRDDLPEFFSRYGFIIHDECHHVPAATFEACMREAPVRYILGLTATPYRRDGLEDMIAMQCGPIRHRMAEGKSNLLLKLNVCETEFALPSDGEIPIQEVFGNLVPHETRNALIEQDVQAALSRGRRCLILSHRREHCRLLAERLSQKGKSPFILNGGQGKKERVATLKAIQETPQDKDLIVVATGQYLGEGFDCPQLDTLFLAFPVAFKGKLIQYIGRIMREVPGKTWVEVYDYVDVQVPVLKHMFFRRQRTYKYLGFNMASAQAGANGQKVTQENLL